MAVLFSMIDHTAPNVEGSAVCHVEREPYVKELADAHNLPEAVVDRIIDGFTLCRDAMISEGRAVWKPKQEYRALRRGFFEVSQQGKKELLFSIVMARESAIHLVNATPFQYLPREWKTQSVDAALARMNNERGDWFEDVVADNLRTIGFYGRTRWKSVAGVVLPKVEIPPAVGEIDYIGYSPSERLLLVIETKMVSASTEPKQFRDELTNFLDKPKSYTAKFRKKVEWVREHIEDVCCELRRLSPDQTAIEPHEIGSALVTFFPLHISTRIREWPCITITEIRLAYEESQNWPYVQGRYALDEVDPPPSD